MSAHREQHLELCAAMVLGAIEPAERAELEAHLAAGCPVCEAELARLSEGAELLAHAAPQHRAPAALRTRVLEAVMAEPKRTASDAAAARAAAPKPPLALRPRPRVSFGTLAWAAAAAVLAVTSVLAWRASNELGAQLATAREQAARLQKQLDDERAWAQLLDAPGAKTVALAPTPDAKTGIAARVTFDPASGRAVLVCENATAPAGHDYELWGITAAGAKSLGLVRADASGRAIVRLDHVAGAEAIAAFGLSLEAEGGAPTPDAPGGPVVMVGKLGG